MPSRAPKRPGTGPAGKVAELIKRRRDVRRWYEGADKDRPSKLVGLALSGGGIRSATFSLGLIQALAKSSSDALSKIDIVSTVSGGGYAGCFLRSLFMPDDGRGLVPKVGHSASKLTQKAIANQHGFARAVLESSANGRTIEWADPGADPVDRRNPLWWLREHSRYLAPNGATDFSFAIAYLARNWLAMLYIFVLGSLAIFSTLILGEAAARHNDLLPDWSWWVPLGLSGERQLACGTCLPGAERALPVSPFFLLLVIPMIGTTVHYIAYWMTQAMSPNEPVYSRQLRNLIWATGGTIVSAIAIVGLSVAITPGALTLDVDRLTRRPPGTLFVWALTAGLALMFLGAVTALVYAYFLRARRAGLTSELRRRLTQSSANCNLAFVVIASIALIDSFGAGIAHSLRHGIGQSLSAAIGAVLPFLAYFIKKLPDWFGKKNGKGSAFSMLGRFFNTIALFAGIMLFGALAVGADAGVHMIIWLKPNAAWVSGVDWPRLWLLVGIIWVLALLSGTASGFINLSSLHGLYSARLTRAYLGATNNERLKDAALGHSSITESHGADYIQPQIYSRADLPAPIHILSSTINETIDPQSQLVARDRKGYAITVEPGGVRVADELVHWGKLGDPKCSEQLSLGQWCAISGAAASSGMGRLTNLGLALAFTFANVRLGYWWWSPGVCTPDRHPDRLLRTFSKFFGTYIYLFDEMTARYSRAYQRKYLTDGGHFENTAAYRLIQRRVPLIVLSDNGADPNYRFEDLENLARKVRLDLGGELEIVGGADLTEFLDGIDAWDRSLFVDPALWNDWRDAFVSPENRAFVIVLRANMAGEILHLVWLKPRLLAAMPADLLGYSAANPQFPQQPTSDQFFDEAQWESYRKLGELSMARLLLGCPGLLK